MTLSEQRREWLWYGAVVLLMSGGVLLVQAAGNPAGLALLGAVLLLPVALLIFWQRPEWGVYLLLALVTFGSEYSQTEWGVRSADQLATIYNRRIIPGLIASIFDLIFAGVLALWLVRKFLRREPLAGLPRRLWPPLLLSLAFTGYAALLGLYRLPEGYELYHVMRELRPFLYLLAMLVMTVDIITLRGQAMTLWRLMILLAIVRGVQGIIRHYLGIGRFYYGTTMVYYDYADTILLLTGMSLLLVWLLGRERLRLPTLAMIGLAMAPMLYAFVFSYRRSFWVGTAISLVLLFFYTNGREKWRYLLLGVVGVAVLAVMLVGSGQLALVEQRVASVSDTQNDPSNFFRILDTQNALNAIYESGALGMGFGSRYRVIASVYWQAEFITHVSRASHNGYLYVLMKMGLLGALSWTLFWLANLSVAFELWRYRTGRCRHVGLGVSVVLVACAVGNTFLPISYNLRPMLLLAIVCALAITTWQLQSAEQRAARGDLA